jgi:hypothetical protein
MPDSMSHAASALSTLEHRVRVVRWIALGSLVVNAVAVSLALVVVLRAPGSPATAALPTKLDELTVGRLNIVEPDGTPRMILASRAKFPGEPVRGKELSRPDRRDLAGILFVNDEGTENGGLVQNGRLDASGKVVAGLSLTFDRFRQDQVVQVKLDEDGDEVNAGLVVNDVPSHKVFSIDDLDRLADEIRRMAPAEREAVRKREEERGHMFHRRGYFGIRKGVSELVLSDPQGRPRLTLSVSERGEPSIALLDETGRPMRSIDAHAP